MSNKLINGINILLLLILAYVLSQFTWMVMGTTDDFSGLGSSPDLGQNKRVKTQELSAKSISHYKLFGQTAVAAPAAKQIVRKAPVTKLKLKLKGVFVAGGDGQGGSAIIADGSGADKYYKRGALLPGGVTLDAVLHDRVILLRSNGNKEELRLPQSSIGGVVTVRPLTTSNRQRKSSPVTRQRSLREYRDTLLKNPQDLADLLTVEPYMENGKLRGYRINASKDKRLFEKYGFKSGDIVTAINGIDLSSPANGFAIIKNIAKAKDLSIDIIRDGATFTTIVDMDD